MSTSLYSTPRNLDDFDFESHVLEPSGEDVHQECIPSAKWAGSRKKRAFDILVAGSAMLPLLPLMAVIAVAIKLSSPGPVVFRQMRTGKGQVPFTIYKYRTMRVRHGHAGPTVTRKNDSRMTKIGLWLRRFKLDELPQLFNVIRGDMSLVGPRPKAIGHECMNLVCRPGITGAATLLFSHEEDLLMQVPEEECEHFTINVLNPIKAHLDTQYVEDGTFLTDLGILATTAFRLGRGRVLRSLPELTEIYSETQVLQKRAG